MEVIKRSCRACPSCGGAISRTEGCNHVVCGYCSTHFCYNCGEHLDAARPYDHFKADGCRVFPDQTGAAPQRIMRPFGALEAEAGMRAEVRIALLGAQRALMLKRCPFCARQTLMGDNRSNHHTCENCGGAFCFRCMADLRRGARGHFRPSGCPQHA